MGWLRPTAMTCAAPKARASCTMFNPTPPTATTATRSPGRTDPGMGDRTVGGQDGATQDSRGLQVQADRHPEHRRLRGHRVLGQARHRVHGQRGAVRAVQAGRAVVQRSAQPIEGEERLAQVVTAARTGTAEPARHQERRNHRITGRAADDAGTHRLHDAGHLVSQHTGGRERHLALDHMQIRVAHAACSNPQQHLARFRLGPGYGLHTHSRSGLVEHGCAHHRLRNGVLLRTAALGSGTLSVPAGQPSAVSCPGRPRSPWRGRRPR